MNTCDTCKFWFARCEDDRTETICTNENLDCDKRGETACGCDAYAEGNRTGAILTGPKFGCIHHESKPFVEMYMLNTPENNKLMSDSGAVRIP